MDPTHTLESRVEALESSLRRSRRLALLLGVALVGITATAMVPQAPDQVTTQRLVLTGPGSPGVVLLAGPGSSLVIQTPTGEEVLRLGGPAGRQAHP
mgnify:CR=1 FL=1